MADIFFFNSVLGLLFHIYCWFATTIVFPCGGKAMPNETTKIFALWHRTAISRHNDNL